MSALHTKTMSLRSAQLRARAPRTILAVTVAILCVAGLKAIINGPPAAALAPPPAPVTSDLGAESFAEGFARAYLTWRPDDDGAREGELARFLPENLDPDGGLAPADGTAQTVLWTAIAGARTQRGASLVTVAARTRAGDGSDPDAAEQTVYVSVPVARDRHGFLYVRTYPAIVGPPATTRAVDPPDLPPVQDAQLSAVVSRALTNYLAGERTNLLADLTPDAVVSLPDDHLRVTGVTAIAWTSAGRRVAAEVQATGAGSGSWTLRYELEVRRTDRWYVRSLQVDPTFKGAR